MADSFLGLFCRCQLPTGGVTDARVCPGSPQEGPARSAAPIARVILEKPDWLFLDEGTSALDEELEAEIYRMLSDVLPNTTIVSIGHRSTLIALHRRHIEMEPGQGWYIRADAKTPRGDGLVGSGNGFLPLGPGS